MGAVEEMMCVVYVSVTEGTSGDGYDLFELGKGATSEAEKYLFRVANVWWRCSQYFVIASCG